MLFRATGKTNTYEQLNTNHYHEVVESSHRSTAAFNSSYGMEQKCQEKIIYNNTQPFFNVQFNGTTVKKVPTTKMESSMNRPSSSSYFKLKPKMEYSQGPVIHGSEVSSKMWT
jgi:hypothetical protein